MLILFARSSLLSLQTIYVIAGILAVIAGVLYSRMSMSEFWLLASFDFVFSRHSGARFIIKQTLALIFTHPRPHQSAFRCFTSVVESGIPMKLAGSELNARTSGEILCLRFIHRRLLVMVALR